MTDFVKEMLKAFAKNKNTRMKLIGQETWILTTRVDREGIALYDVPEGVRL